MTEIERTQTQQQTALGPPGRHFGDEEIQDILRRAADLQERSAAVGDGAGRGLTLAEIRQVAREAGIDPRFVDIAVTDRGADIESTESRLLGGRTMWHYRVKVPGEIEDRDREQILIAIRAALGNAGALADVYGRMEWTHNDGMGPILIGVTSRDGQTEIDVTATRNGEPGLYHGLGVPFGGVAGGAILAGLTGLAGVALVPLVSGAAALSYIGARALWASRSKHWERKFDQLVERISMIVQERAALPAPRGEGGA